MARTEFRAGQFTGFEVELRPPGIALITFNEPERMNGLTPPKKRDLIETLTQAQMSDEVRVVVFAGAGRAFCAGDSLTGYSAAAEGRVPEIFHGHHNPIGTYNGLRTISQGLNLAVRNLDKMTVAAVNGYAIQTGLSLALSCDFRVAASDAQLGSATLRFALLPDEGGQALLVQHLGLGRALDFMLRKRIVSAEEALSLGLVNEVVEPERLLDTALALAEELATGPQVAMRMLKRSIYNAAELTFNQALDEIASKTALTDWHADAKEGQAAFVEKRKPQFNAWLERS
ncbi:MAG: enoyl-CoA hydratase/isomerase family protein [Acidimicrobiales bacterium]